MRELISIFGSSIHECVSVCVMCVCAAYLQALPTHTHTHIQRHSDSLVAALCCCCLATLYITMQIFASNGKRNTLHTDMDGVDLAKLIVRVHCGAIFPLQEEDATKQKKRAQKLQQQ